MALSADSVNNNVWEPPKLESLNGHVDISVDITVNDGRTPLRAAATNGLLDVTLHLLGNGGSVHITKKRNWTAQLAAAYSGHVEVFHKFLKHPLTW